MFSLLDLIFPKFCIGCNKFSTYLCENCKKNIIYMDYDKCIVCGKENQEGLTHKECLSKTNIDGNFSIFRHNNIIRKIMKNIKYKLATDMLSTLFSLIQKDDLKRQENLINSFHIKNEEIFLQPVPLHQNRFNSRGFNQSLIFAEFFSKTFSIPIIQSINRVLDTKQQAKMKNRKEREENIKNAFVLLEKPKKNIIIIDDVLTTGETVSEIARLLKNNGCENVFVFTMAHG